MKRSGLLYWRITGGRGDRAGAPGKTHGPPALCGPTGGGGEGERTLLKGKLKGKLEGCGEARARYACPGTLGRRAKLACSSSSLGI